MRAFLRQPSTPWIVFNRASQPSGLSIGDVLPAAASSVLSGPVFPEAEPSAAPASEAEPSNLVVATDVTAEPPSGAVAGLEADPFGGEDVDAIVAPRRSPRRLAFAAGATVAVAACVALVAGVGRSSANGPAKAAAAANVVTAAKVAPDAPPPSLDLHAVESSAAAPAPPKAGAASEDAKPEHRFGKLAISGKAKYRRVYMDGKLLLGSGARSFLVKCGEHRISIGKRTGGETVVVPCNGRFVVRK